MRLLLRYLSRYILKFRHLTPLVSEKVNFKMLTSSISSNMRKAIILIVGVIIPIILILLVYKGYHLLFEANVNESITPYSLYVDEDTSIDQVYAKFIAIIVLLTPEGFLLLANKKDLYLLSRVITS